VLDGDVGAENDFVSYHTTAHYEVAPSFVIDAHLSPPALLLINKARVGSLPADQQEAITHAAIEASIYQREIMREANKAARQTVSDSGATVTEIDKAPFQAAVQPIYEKFPVLLPLLQRIADAK
jgi:TRAP-type C4-dicarboxylate transport system substrate-binding protein